MAQISHFSHGFINPLMGFGFALSGSLLGLFCMIRARRATTTGSRVARLFYATIALGGTGIWMMHFTAMIGFDVAGSDVRYDLGVTALSLVISIASTAFGIYVVGLGQKSVAKVLIGGPLTGLGVVAMHYTGMGAVRVNGTIDYNPILFITSVVIAVVAATVALAFAVWVSGRRPILLASLIMAIAVCGMHYTGMASVSVRLDAVRTPVSGVDPILLLIPIMVLATMALVGLIFGLLSDSEEAIEELNPPAPRELRLEGRRAFAEPGSASASRSDDLSFGDYAAPAPGRSPGAAPETARPYVTGAMPKVDAGGGWHGETDFSRDMDYPSRDESSPVALPEEIYGSERPELPDPGVTSGGLPRRGGSATLTSPPVR